MGQGNTLPRNVNTWNRPPFFNTEHAKGTELQQYKYIPTKTWPQISVQCAVKYANNEAFISSSRKEHTFFPNYAAMGKQLPSKQEKQVARITLRQPPSHCQCRLKLCHKKWGWVAENKRGYQLDCSLVSGRQLFYKRQRTFQSHWPRKQDEMPAKGQG